ncbi:hypothetical protein F5Y10DRAFT_283980 [Nemania abortiva]|nr:hypothetical protein F5Y10DRAFT_283980 [Nemania abortiva]
MICTKDTVRDNGLNIWSLPEAGCSPVVDIIAVQGLNPNPFYTWVRKVPRVDVSTTRKRKREGDDENDQEVEVMWPRDLLPSDVKNARIATYSYFSDWMNTDFKTSLRECSEQFLDILSNHRRRDEERRRPLILIGHSFGGLVIEEALNTAAAHGNRYSDIHHSVTGILFLGVPFKGCDLATHGTWLARLAGYDTTLIDVLHKGSPHLYHVSRDFWDSYEGTDIVVDPQSASIQGKRTIHLKADHSGLSKFSGANDENYLLLRAEIQRMVEDVPSRMVEVAPPRVVEDAPSVMAMKYNQAKQKPHWTVPFDRNNDFVGRNAILEQLRAKIPPSVDEYNCQRTAIEGLGGIGKTQVALEAAFQVRNMHPDCSIFWVPAVDALSFERAYYEIGKTLGFEEIDEKDVNLKTLVKEGLDRESSGKWLLIIDNIDGTQLFSGDARIFDYLPTSNYNGSILFTTRDHKAAVVLASTKADIIQLERFGRDESYGLLGKLLNETHIQNLKDTDQLLDRLEDLPLAVKQASAYMAKENITTTKYLELCRSSDVDNILDEDFIDLYRYQGNPNPALRTFYISFEKISERDPLAAAYLRHISFLSEKNIPRSLLPPAQEREATRAIGTLKGYAFITEQEEENTYDVHRLVQLSTLHWLAKTGGRQEWATKVFKRFTTIKPWEDKEMWETYIPHAQNLKKFLKHVDDITTKEELLRQLGQSLRSVSRNAEAKGMFKEALLLIEYGAQGQWDSKKLELLDGLACVLGRQLRYKEAERVWRNALELRREIGLKNHSTVKNMREIARLLVYQRKYKESEDLHWQTIYLLREILPGGKKPLSSYGHYPDVFWQEAGVLRLQACRGTCRRLYKEIIYLVISFATLLLWQERMVDLEELMLGFLHKHMKKKLIEIHAEGGPGARLDSKIEASDLWAHMIRHFTATRGDSDPFLPFYEYIYV